MRNTVYKSWEQRRILPVFRDLYRARALLVDLVTKDLRARYRYAALGFFWAVLEPLALMLVLSFIFSVVLVDKADFAKGEGSRPYAVTLLCALVFWQFFQTALNNATQSLTDNHSLVNKVYFPREIIPLAAVCQPVAHLGIGLMILLLIHVALGGAVGLGLLWLLPLFAIQFVMICGLGLLFSCGHVLYRDIGYMVNVALLFGFYATPIFYPIDLVTQSDLLPSWAVQLYLCNPMAGLVTAYREVLFTQQPPAMVWLAWPGLFSLLSMSIGLILFRRTSPTLSDYL